MKNTYIALFIIAIGVQCFSRTVAIDDDVGLETATEWIENVNYLLKNYFPFKTDIIGQDFDRIKREDDALSKTLEMFFHLGTDYQRELSKDPRIKNMDYNVGFKVRADISEFELLPSHTNLNCYELFELVARETTNSFTYHYNPQVGRVFYEIK